MTCATGDVLKGDLGASVSNPAAQLLEPWFRNQRKACGRILHGLERRTGGDIVTLGSQGSVAVQKKNTKKKDLNEGIRGRFAFATIPLRHQLLCTALRVPVRTLEPTHRDYHPNVRIISSHHTLQGRQRSSATLPKGLYNRFPDSAALV